MSSLLVRRLFLCAVSSLFGVSSFSFPSPHICIIARHEASARGALLAPAFIHSLAAGNYSALSIFLLDTEAFANRSQAVDPTLCSVAQAARASGVMRAVVVSPPHEDALDAFDVLLTATGWSGARKNMSEWGGSGPWGDGPPDLVRGKGEWTRGYVSTDIVMNRLVRCKGNVRHPCAWPDTDHSGSSGKGFGIHIGSTREDADPCAPPLQPPPPTTPPAATSAPMPCDYILVTNTDNLYAEEFLPLVLKKGILPLWPKKQNDKNNFHNAWPRRIGRDAIGVYYVTHYATRGSSSSSSSSSHGVRLVNLPHDGTMNGQSVDLGAFLWSTRALYDANATFLVGALRAAMAGGGGSGGGDGGKALAAIWPTVGSRDHSLALQVNQKVIVPRRREEREVKEFIKAANHHHHHHHDNVNDGGNDDDDDDDPVKIMTEILFWHQ
jgi:hypothetical protein